MRAQRNRPPRHEVATRRASLPPGDADGCLHTAVRLGRQFGWLWAAYAVSATGTWLGFGAFPLIAILVLHVGPAAVSVLAAAGLAVGAVAAVPLGPWVEFRRKRPVMISMDLIRCAALLSVPIAYALGLLTFVQLLIVSIVVAASNIAFTAASGAYLKKLVAPAELLVANARFESTTWTATALGPPLGGLAIALLGPVTTALADALSFLLSAAGIGAIGGSEPPPPQRGPAKVRLAELLDGWRSILRNPVLRPWFANTILVNGLIMATLPLIAVLMLGRLGFAPWQYGLAFGAPCVAGFMGSRAANPLVARYGRESVLRTAGTVRTWWSLGLAFIPSGTAGIVLVIVMQSGLVGCCGVFNPVFATYRIERTETTRLARTLAAWSVSSNLMIAAMTALWGVLAALTGLRVAIAGAGLLMLTTPLLIPRRERLPVAERSLQLQ
jgi:Major Facilitator Superfamily